MYIYVLHFYVYLAPIYSLCGYIFMYVCIAYVCMYCVCMYVLRVYVCIAYPRIPSAFEFSV